MATTNFFSFRAESQPTEGPNYKMQMQWKRSGRETLRFILILTFASAAAVKEQDKNKLSCTSTCLLYQEQSSTSNLVLVQDNLYRSCTYLVFRPKNKLSCTSTCLLYREQFSTSNLVLVQDILYLSCTYLVFRLKNKLSCTGTCLLYREQFSTSNLVLVQAVLFYV